MIEFQEVSLEGFGSFVEPATFKLNLPGLNILQAPNGKGKTTLISSIPWAIYGKKLKEDGRVESYEWVRGSNWNGTKVELKLKIFKDKDIVKVKIIRCKDFKGEVEGSKGKDRLIVLVNGKALEGVRDKKEVQSKLEELIGYSFDLFKNSILFGQKLKRLISESGPKKKEVFEEAFDLLYIAKAKDRVKEDNDKLLKEKSSLYLKIETIESNINLINNDLNNLENTRAQFYANKKIKIKELHTKRVKLSKEVNLLKTEFQENNFDEEISQRQGIIDQHRGKVNKPNGINLGITENTVKTLEDEIKTLKDNKLEISKKEIPSFCFNCNKPFTKKEKLEEKGRIDKILEDLSLSIKEKEKRLKKEKAKLNILKVKYDKYFNKEKEILDIEKHVKKLEKKKLEYINKIHYTQKELFDIKDRIKELKKEEFSVNLEEWNNNLKKFTEELEPLNVAYKKVCKALDINKWLIDDPLSNSGLKVFIFDNMLKEINKWLRFYKRFVGFQVVFSINMKSSNKDICIDTYRRGHLVNYGDLSGGEQQLVDVVTAFALHDMITYEKDCNILIMDEVFESLSKNNIEIVSELVQYKASLKNVYLITHLQDFIVSNSNIIKVLLDEKGRSSISY